MAKIVVIVQARLDSTRLPRKVLADICGRPMIQHVLERAKLIPGIDRVILSVPLGQGAELEKVSKPLGVNCWEGPHPDMLSAYVIIADTVKADVVMRITGDCPLIDPELCGYILKTFLGAYSPLDYCANVGPQSNYPDGLDCEVVSNDILQRANKEATAFEDRHHVMPWIRSNGAFRYLTIKDKVLAEHSKGIKWSVDTAEDLEWVRKIMARVKSTNWMDTLRAYEEKANASD